MIKMFVMKIRMIQLLLILCIFYGVSTLHAQNVITTAVPFLRISPDARASGMGDVGVATTPDASAAFWNMGKVVFNEAKGGVVASYSPWLRDISSDMYLAALAGYYKLDEEQAINASVRYFNLGDLQFSDEFGNYLQGFHPREWAADLGYSRKLSAHSGIGLTFRYIHSGLSNTVGNGNDYKSGNAVAVDLGYYYKLDNGWSFGGALSNLGSKIAYTKNADQKDFIPANLGLGAAFSKSFNEQNRISVGLDVTKLLVPTLPDDADSAKMVAYRNKSVVGSWFSSFGDAPGGFREELKEFQVSIGGEYWYNNQFALRAGYFYEDKSKGNRRYFTVGAEVRYRVLQLNFSYLAGEQSNPLRNTLRFGLAFELQ
jgi:hypothetical protein